MFHDAIGLTVTDKHEIQDMQQVMAMVSFLDTNPIST
jgi:hypothetical protein